MALFLKEIVQKITGMRFSTYNSTVLGNRDLCTLLFRLKQDTDRDIALWDVLIKEAERLYLWYPKNCKRFF